jgi:hypothetical protein
MARTDEALARLKAGSDTPIHDTLIVETTFRQLTISLSPMIETFKRAMEGLGRVMARAAENFLQPPPSPDEVLARIREDQASLDWHEMWRADRQQAKAEELGDPMLPAYPAPRGRNTR